MQDLYAALDRAPSGALRAFTEHCARLCEHLVGHPDYRVHKTAQCAQTAASFPHYHKARDARDAAWFSAQALAFADEAPFEDTVRGLKKTLDAQGLRL